MGARGGSGGLGAFTMAHYPFVDRGVGLFRKYGPEAVKGQWEAGAKGGSWRRRSRSPERGGGGCSLLYLIKAGLLPVRVHPVPHKGRAPARSVHPVPHIKAGLLPVRFILYLIKAGLLPVRFRPPIAGAATRWPEGEGGGVLPGAAVLHDSGGSGWHRSRARARGRPRRFRVRQAPE